MQQVIFFFVLSLCARIAHICISNRCFKVFRAFQRLLHRKFLHTVIFLMCVLRPCTYIVTVPFNSFVHFRYCWILNWQNMVILFVIVFMCARCAYMCSDREFNENRAFQRLRHNESAASSDFFFTCAESSYIRQ